MHMTYAVHRLYHCPPVAYRVKFKFRENLCAPFSKVRSVIAVWSVLLIISRLIIPSFVRDFDLKPLVVKSRVQPVSF